MSEKAIHQIKLRKHLTIGSISAENDQKYLLECFIDTGDYETLVDIEDDRSIVLGRTGCGKSALIEMIKNREEKVIEINPEELALNYISHSNILALLESCGVNLDPFYQLLWKHVFAVELIKFKYQISDATGYQRFIDGLADIFKKDRSKGAAVGYWTKWHDKFWLPVEERVREITTKIEAQLSEGLQAGGELSVVSGLLNASLSMKERNAKIETLSKEEKEEIKSKVQAAVDSVQVQELHRVIKILGDNIFSDPKQKFYVVIDKIDENWVEDRTRYKLIRALIETIKSFRKIRSVKFALAMRLDLLQSVFDKTRDKGFQEDKYRDYILNVRWTSQDLQEMLSRRVAHLYQRQYEKASADLFDLLPRRVGAESTLEWLKSRSLMRPRDIIVYVNLCLDRAAGTSNITATNIRDMEVSYSGERFRAVCQEWAGDYPELEVCLGLLKRKKNGFTHSEVDRDAIDESANSILLLDLKEGGEISKSVESYLNKEISRSKLLNRFIAIFYVVGIVGIKRDGHESAIWSSLDSPIVTESEIKRSSHFYIHPMFWRSLGVHVDKRKR